MSTQFALAIPHCPWDPHRVQNLSKLKERLEIRNDHDECDHARVSIFASVGPTPNWIWSDKLFRWLAEQDTEWSLQVQDDVLLVPEFWDVLKAAVAGAETAGAEAISLFTIAPPAPHFAHQGCNWLTTTDWMVGPAWLVKTKFLRDQFVPFRDRRLRTGWNEPDPQTKRLRSGLNEDTLLGLGCAAFGKRIWNPLPALVDHDTSIGSTYGNAGGKYNKSSFNWVNWMSMPGHPDVQDLKLKEFWIPRNSVQGPRTPAVHLGCAYSFTTYNFLRWCKDDGEDYGGLPWDKRADAIRMDTVNLGVV